MNKDLIYKYVPFSINSLKTLIKGELWFGLPKNLNDPYEGEFLVKEYNNLPEESLIDFFYEKMGELLNGESLEIKKNKIKSDPSLFHIDVYLSLKNRLRKFYGISSFSYDPKNILMWSHYADSHKGFCIAFNKAELFESLKHSWKDIYDIDYKPNLTYAELELTKTRIAFQNEKEILYSKLDIWQKENETRIVIFKYKSEKSYVSFNKSCIKGINIGENMSNDDELTLKKLIQNDPEYKNVKFQKAVKNLTKKEMDIT